MLLGLVRGGRRSRFLDELSSKLNGKEEREKMTQHITR